ncbi:MAG: hypothetical protein AAF604_23295 [Acidobacteriota bacterium]
MRRSLALLAAVGLLIGLLAVPSTADDEKTRTGVFIQWVPINLKVFTDKFNGRNTYATYSALGNATVSIHSGRLWVDMPASPSAGDGLKMELPSTGTGVRCLDFGGLDIAPAALGARMTWVWFGFDDQTGDRIEIRRVEMWTEDGDGLRQDKQFKIKHTKENGEPVEHTVEGKDWDDVASKRWDTKNNGTKVQLEIEFKDGTEYNSDWLDPPASTISGFEVSGDGSDFSLDSVGGGEFHTQSVPAEPVEVATFAEARFNAVPNYFIGQTGDADLVVVARLRSIEQRTSPVSFDPRPRLRAQWNAETVLKGIPNGERLTVLHALEDEHGRLGLRPGDRAILYLRRGEEPRGLDREWYWDFGPTVGRVPFSDQNLRAAASRIRHFFHGGS